ncbi:hypothetical protein PIB30_083315 [Stylosanthes scabra]|uniref:Zinc finger GRF-type domain-containing protein n=1 Tax=Stylosanthes scabra TaxID=79078 RepID=A0ABU6TU55_9FABA|nr:hypothetical protein [Stylosanthes scabra]
MASQCSQGLGSRSSWSTASAQRRMFLCSHGERPVLRVSRTKQNPGRHFWGCAYYGDEAEEDPEKAKLEKKVLSLKKDMRACVWRLKIVVFVGLVWWLLIFSMGLQKSGAYTQHQAVPLKADMV